MNSVEKANHYKCIFRKVYSDPREAKTKMYTSDSHSQDVEVKSTAVHYYSHDVTRMKNNLSHSPSQSVETKKHCSSLSTILMMWQDWSVSFSLTECRGKEFCSSLLLKWCDKNDLSHSHSQDAETKANTLSFSFTGCRDKGKHTVILIHRLQRETAVSQDAKTKTKTTHSHRVQATKIYLHLILTQRMWTIFLHTGRKDKDWCSTCYSQGKETDTSHSQSKEVSLTLKTCRKTQIHRHMHACTHTYTHTYTHTIDTLIQIDSVHTHTHRVGVLGNARERAQRKEKRKEHSQQELPY